MPTATFATQPRHWLNFSDDDCQWCEDFDHATNIQQQARLQGEPVAIWKIPNAPGAKPIKWM